MNTRITSRLAVLLSLSLLVSAPGKALAEGGAASFLARAGNYLLNESSPGEVARLVRAVWRQAASAAEGRSAGFAAVPPATPQPAPANGSFLHESSRLTRVSIADLDANELRVLAAYDVTVLVDRSRSMLEKDCPPPARAWTGESVSRWDWCREQVSSLSRQAGAVLRKGLTLVTFSTRAQVYPNVSLNEVSQVFSTTEPAGGTNLTAALKGRIEDYFKRKKNAAGAVRPLAIAVITDGLPDSSRSLERLIVDATRSLSAPGEIKITFLQVGRTADGAALVSRLDDMLIADGARFDIVDSMTFDQLSRSGLPRALTVAMTERE